jgi:hypothetical protein
MSGNEGVRTLFPTLSVVSKWLQKKTFKEDTQRMIGRFFILLLLTVSTVLPLAQGTPNSDRHAPTFVEKVSLDWDHSGVPTTFTLSYQHRTDGAGDSDRLVINRKGNNPWILLNNDDAWTTLVTVASPQLIHRNLVSSKRMLFVSSGAGPKVHIYLILKGGGYGCCVGSLTVITPGEDGAPKIVFHAVEHLLQDILLLPDGSGIALIGQSSDAEARAQKNAESYNPYRVYIIMADQPARYDLERSKAYNIEHYCEWAGPTYNEKFIAVNVDPGQFGATHCRAMTEAQFNAYREKHTAQFPEE